MTQHDLQQFILAHRTDDPRRLALSGSLPAGVDMPYVLQQIQGWQTARHKLPTWAAVDDLVYPPHINMEQCSSEATARYKARLVASTLGVLPAEARLIDLTGGFGVDFSFVSRPFGHALYVERQEHLCTLARANFERLGLTGYEVVCADGTEWLRQAPTDGALAARTVIYLDPARRDVQGRKVYGIADCDPDVATLMPLLMVRASVVLIKLSPMLDWHAALHALAPGGCGAEVHIVSAGGECKELLLLLTHRATALRVVCVNDDHVFSYTPGEAADDGTPLPAAPQAHRLEGFLYVPHASIMKAGCFDEVARRYGVAVVDKSSHLFVADTMVSDFPGRCFRITATSSMNKHELRQKLAGVTQANIAVRHFPLSVDELRRKLKLRDGGSLYLFATTWQDKHVLLLCERLPDVTVE